MLTTAELLDLAKARAGISSDYRLAQVIGVTKQSLTNYRQGRSSPDERASTELAKLAQLDPGEVAAWLQAERARDDQARSLWRQVAERLQRAGVAGLAGLAAFTGTPDAGAFAAVPGRLAETPESGVMESRLDTPPPAVSAGGLYVM